MSFGFYTNAISQASKNFAMGIFSIGLLLIGFGVIIIALPELFAMLAAIVFFIAGGGCAVTALKIFFAQRRFSKMNSDNSEVRKNVQIHTEDHFGL